MTLAAAQNSPKTVVATDQVRAELLAHAPDGVTPGKPVWVGLQIMHKPEWHTYWKNSGDSGLPTLLEWQLPTGVTAGEIAWPAPHKILIGNLANYGYEGTVLLPVPLTIGPDFKPSLLSSDLEVKLKASWLVCRKECIPEEGEFVLKIPVKSTTALDGAAFDASCAAQPKALIGQSTAEVDGKRLKLTVAGLPTALQGKTLDFFPETPEVIETAAAWTQAWSGNTWTAQVPLAEQRSNSPTTLPMVLGVGDGTGNSYWRTEAQVSGAWPQLAAAAGVSPALQAALQANAGTNAAAGAAAGVAPSASTPPRPLSFTMALLGALLGGLILNLMPCVFPVLAIKLVGFAATASSTNAKAALRAQGVAYTVGVIGSFLALGGVLLALRAGGEQLGWGFQLQSPAMVAGLAVLFMLIALNLLGVFEVGMLLPSRACTAQAKHPMANAALSGVLAVAIASPCTAPFMGASLGLAVGLPAVQALLVFAAIGVGMALPYLAASLVPAVAGWLPRPGAWMVVFRRFMAFPMLATVAWLVWVLGQQSGIDGAGALLATLLVIAMTAWAFSLQGRARAVLASLSTAALVAVLLEFGPLVVTPADAALSNTAASSNSSANTTGWQPWQPGRVEQLQATGQTVFVDFTAAWCVTCQYNKKTTLANPQVRADLAAKNIALLHADWTRRDPAISAALSSLGRSGVPLYVFYKAGRPPVILSEVLSVDDVRVAIAQL